MIKLIIVRGSSALLSLVLLLFLSKYYAPDISDKVYIDMSLLIANTILLSFGFDKKIWNAFGMIEAIRIYNNWFQRTGMRRGRCSRN